MTEQQATEILNLLPAYQIIDVNVVRCDGTSAEADVTFERTVEGAIPETIRYNYERNAGGYDVLQTYDARSFDLAFQKEVADECREAVLYRRDELRAMN